LSNQADSKTKILLSPKNLKWSPGGDDGDDGDDGVANKTRVELNKNFFLNKHFSKVVEKMHKTLLFKT
jgi:hypothetical protein